MSPKARRKDSTRGGERVVCEGEWGWVVRLRGTRGRGGMGILSGVVEWWVVGDGERVVVMERERFVALCSCAQRRESG